MAEGKVEVTPKTTGVVSAKESDVTLFRNKAEQDAYVKSIERLRNPRLVDLWTGAVDLGYAQAKANAQLSYQVTGSSRYLSNPLPGRKTHDLVITTGIRLVFAQ